MITYHLTHPTSIKPTIGSSSSSLIVNDLQMRRKTPHPIITRLDISSTMDKNDDIDFKEDQDDKFSTLTTHLCSLTSLTSLSIEFNSIFFVLQDGGSSSTTRFYRGILEQIVESLPYLKKLGIANVQLKGTSIIKLLPFLYKSPSLVSVRFNSGFYENIWKLMNKSSYSSFMIIDENISNVVVEETRKTIQLEIDLKAIEEEEDNGFFEDHLLLTFCEIKEFNN